MRNVNPFMHAIRIADKMIGDSIRSDLRRARNQIKAKEYLTAKHDYKLVAQGQELGPRATMVGSEAKAQNKVLLQIYQDEVRAEIEAGVEFGKTTSTLKRWVLDKPNQDAIT